MTKNGAIYEAKVHELKLKDRKSRLFYALRIAVFELLVLILLLQFLGLPAFIGFIIGLFFFIPTPYITVPDSYKIINGAVLFDQNKVLSLKKEYKLRRNKEGNMSPSSIVARENS